MFVTDAVDDGVQATDNTIGTIVDTAPGAVIDLVERALWSHYLRLGLSDPTI